MILLKNDEITDFLAFKNVPATTPI